MVILQIVSPDATIYQEFGYAVSLSQDYIVIGAPGDDMMGANSGMIYIYKLGNSNGVFTATFDASYMAGMNTANARFGTSVAIYYGSNDVAVPENPLSEWVVTGAPGLNVTGMACVYARIEGYESSWEPIGNVWPPEVTFAVNFGQSVAWYNDYLVRIIFAFNKYF